MKKAAIICLMAFGTLTVHAQQFSLFGKKKHEKKEAEETGVIDGRAKIDERTHYFVTTVLPTNDIGKIEQFINTGIDLNVIATEVIDYGGQQTILTYALRSCNLKTVKCLLSRGADPNARYRLSCVHMKTKEPYYKYGQYPLEVATEMKDTAKVGLLLRSGAKLNLCLDAVQAMATKKGDMVMINYLSRLTGSSSKVKVPADALATITDDSYEHDISTVTPDVINDLLAKGADINAYSGSGHTVLINVMINGKIKDRMTLIKLCLQKGADPNKESIQAAGYRGNYKFHGVSPLKYAIASNNLDMVKLLVESGADIHTGKLLAGAKKNEIKEYLIMKGVKD